MIFDTAPHNPTKCDKCGKPSGEKSMGLTTTVWAEEKIYVHLTICESCLFRNVIGEPRFSNLIAERVGMEKERRYRESLKQRSFPFWP